MSLDLHKMVYYLKQDSDGIPLRGQDIRATITADVGNDFYLVHNGRLVKDTDLVMEGVVHVILRLNGGKGGFGSMLRAIGAQIEKTTNREACRDLSGRRLRDINEEQRLKNWIAMQADQEREIAERRKKRLERLCTEPKHEFKDKEYEKERSELTEKVNDAVEQGYKLASASGSGCSHKRKSASSTITSKTKKKKSSRLWMDADEEDLSSSEDDESSNGRNEKKSQSLLTTKSPEVTAKSHELDTCESNIPELGETTSQPKHEEISTIMK